MLKRSIFTILNRLSKWLVHERRPCLHAACNATQILVCSHVCVACDGHQTKNKKTKQNKKNKQTNKQEEEEEEEEQMLKRSILNILKRFTRWLVH